MAAHAPSLAAIRRKLHAAELIHLRQVVADQQALIEAQALQIAALEREASWAADRADMFHHLANEAMDAAHLSAGITATGQLGLLS